MISFHTSVWDNRGSPLEVKLAEALSKELLKQQSNQMAGGDEYDFGVDCNQLAQVCTRTIKDAMAAALREAAAKRAAQVNAAIDEVTR